MTPTTESNMITANIIADSVVRQHGKRILTFELQYPRFIHSEVMTHRVFSRNAMSSRAVPVAKMIEQVRTNPAAPLKFMKNKPGMQSTEDFTEEEHASVVGTWLDAADSAAQWAEQLLTANVHKQFANRLLEPFQWMRTIVTATEWDNFFDLRCHPDAQPEFQALAMRMRNQMKESKPVSRDVGHQNSEDSWHLPYVTLSERTNFKVGVLPKISAARCARVSYLTHDGEKPDIDKDLELYERLVGADPKHASPIEHQAFPHKGKGDCSGNFVGWVQYRHLDKFNA